MVSVNCYEEDWQEKGSGIVVLGETREIGRWRVRPKSAQKPSRVSEPDRRLANLLAWVNRNMDLVDKTNDHHQRRTTAPPVNMDAVDPSC
jgi:hypothetical protein